MNGRMNKRARRTARKHIRASVYDVCKEFFANPCRMPLRKRIGHAITIVTNRSGRIVRRLSVKTFTNCIHVLPYLACDREPGCWGYPGCVWLSVGWLRWSVQVSLYAWPCEHCIGYTTNAANQDRSESE